MTEHKGLVQLHSFLHNVASDHPNANVAEQAQSMLDNLTFIGEKEYDEATAYIADVWRKSY